MVVPTRQKAIRPGYKETEVGVIPEEWEVKHLSEIADVVRGASPRPAGDARYFNGNFIPWLTVASLTNIPESEMYVSETSGYLTEKGATYSRILEKGTLIIANSGATLGVAKILGIRCCANDGVAALLDLTGCDKEFICQYLNTQTRRLREVVAPGVGQPNLNTRLIGDIDVPFPKAPEQRMIAAALADLDFLSAELDKLIAKKLGMKTAAMQELLTGKRRLSGFREKWEAKKLSDLVAYEQPSAYLVKRAEYSDNYSIPVLTAGKTFILGYTSEETGVFRALPVIIFDDFTTASKYVDFPFKAKSSAMKMLRPRTGTVNLRFMFERMQLIDFKMGDHKRYWISEYQHIGIEVPDPEEQAAIAAVLADIDTDIAALEAGRKKAQALKQGMMQQLLTGNIRLI